ncbi:MAG: hypothetical protein ACPG06_03295 [Alphaproteobacteria bacterium]
MSRLAYLVMPSLLLAGVTNAQVAGDLQPSDVTDRRGEAAGTQAADADPNAAKPLTLDEIIVTAQRMCATCPLPFR